jgi:hypothetical protein
MCIIIIIAISLLCWSFAKSPPQIEYRNSLVVNRNFETVDEERALIAAEKSVDYSAIIALERFNGSNDPEEYIRPGTYLSYTWVNFIDSVVLDYYQTRYDHQHKQISPRGVSFTYNAKVTHLERLHIFNSTQLEQGSHFNHDTGKFEPITWHSTIIAFDSFGNSAPLTTIKPFGYYTLYRNQSEYYALQPNFDLNFSNCYLVEMELKYEENYNPVAGFWVRTHQIIVLDQNLQPVWISIQPAMPAVA